MKKKWFLSLLVLLIVPMLSGCNLLVLDPAGPNAERLSGVIKTSILTMSVVLIVVYVLFIFMLSKYRASKQDPDYKPPHIEGSKVLETIWILIPILIVTFLSIVTVRSTADVEATPKAYKDVKPVEIYASSSNWKWHFSYPEENIETVNYVNIPANRPIEFKLYSHNTMTSFWVPQLAGQKYAMVNMINTLHLAADHPGTYWGRNSNFNGAGFAQMEFEVQAMTQKDYDKWVSDVKATAKPLTEKKFNELLKDGHLGRMTFTGTHLKFHPAPSSHHHGAANEDTKKGGTKHVEEQEGQDMSEHDMSNMEHAH